MAGNSGWRAKVTPCPSLAQMPTATMLAGALTSVALPPRVAANSMAMSTEMVAVDQSV